MSVIHNAMAVDSYSWQRTGNKDKKVVTMGAARLDDPVKGFGLLIEAANVIADSHPDCNIELQLSALSATSRCSDRYDCLTGGLARWLLKRWQT